MEAVDGGDVGEDAGDDVLRDSGLRELSAKYLKRHHEAPFRKTYFTWSRNLNVYIHVLQLKLLGISKGKYNNNNNMNDEN